MIDEDGRRLLERAQLLVELRRPEEAELLLRDCVREHPDVATVHHVLSDVLEQLERYGEAEEVARTSIRLAPNDEIGFHRLAQALIRQDRSDEAVDVAWKAVQIDPGWWANQTLMARALLTSERFGAREAVQHAERALALAPGESEPHLVLALCHIDGRSWRRARREAERALEIDPTDTRAATVLSVVNVTRGRVFSGIRDKSAVMAADPQSGGVEKHYELVAHRLMRRLWFILLATAVVLGVLALVHATWFARAGITTTLVLASAAVTWRAVTLMPSSSPRLLARGVNEVGRENGGWMWLFLLLLVGTLVMGYSPDSVTLRTGEGLMAIFRVIGLCMIVGWIIKAFK